MKRFHLSFAAAVFVLFGFSAAHAGLMHYYNVDEAEDKLIELDGSPFARLFRIGYSYDYDTDPNDPYRYPVYALRISADGDHLEDNYQKNAILFECGMHPREWLSIESCIRLAEHLVNSAGGQRSPVRALLSQVDVWIIPMSNPAGRYLDSPGGDPTLFSTSPSSKGWRGNGDTRLCNYGVNVARNFSRGFDDSHARPTCDRNNEYRGFAPFSTSEANNIRQFVENHNISMAVVIHSTGQQIWNQWGNEDRPGYNDRAGHHMAEYGSTIWKVGLPWTGWGKYELAVEGVGGGNGQLSAWLSKQSERSDADRPQPDQDTLRAIQTIYIELPIDGDTLYDDSPYKDLRGDGSNRFHPSSDNIVNLIERSFIPTATYLISQSRAPGCPTLNTGAPWVHLCYDEDASERDFGLVGAKITRSGHENDAGSLRSIAARQTATDIVPAYMELTPMRSYSLPYRVQSFTTGLNDAVVELTVKIRPRMCARPPCAEESTTYSNNHYNLEILEAESGVFELGSIRSFSEYTLELKVLPLGLTSDSFRYNDKKVFKFRTGMALVGATIRR